MDIRSVIAILGGLVIIFFLAEVLEPPTVAMLAAQRPPTMDAYMAARNESPAVLGRAAMYGVVGILAGYMVAKIAGQHEIAHACAVFLLQALMMLRAFAAEPAAIALGAGTRTLLVLVLGVGILLGASVRTRAARFGSSTEVGS